MDEGVDPTHMCQNLVSKVSQSAQLRSVADSEDILALFEDWLDELEQEILHALVKSREIDPVSVAKQLGLSANGAIFMVAKLRREGKI